MRSHALGMEYPAPLPAGVEKDPNAAAMWCMSMFGNRASFATPHPFERREPDTPLRTHSLLHIGVARRHAPTIEASLAAGMPIDLLAADGLAPLHWALAGDDAAIMTLLLDRGSPVDVRSSEGATPLMTAVQNASLDTVSFLLDHGADVNAHDRRGFTALHRAAEMGREDVAARLLDRGASPNPEAGGHTPRSLAVARGQARDRGPPRRIRCERQVARPAAEPALNFCGRIRIQPRHARLVWRQPLPEHKEHSMELGNFSISLAVKDLEASRQFYEKFGFTVFAGDASQNWLILKNGDHVIGLFQGMFDKNMLTFNPGWDSNAQKLATFTDVRELQRQLKAQGVQLQQRGGREHDRAGQLHRRGPGRKPDPGRPACVSRMVRPFTIFVVAGLFAGVTAAALRIAWNPSIESYVQYVPIAAVFGAFLCDRVLSGWSGHARPAICDAVVVVLALMRVFVPPLPFVSGHTLFATYAALTAGRWPLLAIALLVLAEVVYTKVFASGGWQSMLGGLLVAGCAAAIRRPLNRKSAPCRSPRI